MLGIDQLANYYYKQQSKQLKKCRHCGKRKPLEDFSASARSNDGYFLRCKSCNVPRRTF